MHQHHTMSALWQWSQLWRCINVHLHTLSHGMAWGTQVCDRAAEEGGALKGCSCAHKHGLSLYYAHQTLLYQHGWAFLHVEPFPRPSILGTWDRLVTFTLQTCIRRDVNSVYSVRKVGKRIWGGDGVDTEGGRREWVVAERKGRKVQESWNVFLSSLDFRQRKWADASVILKTHYCGEKSLQDEKRYCDFQGNRENSDWYWLHPYIGKWKGQLKHICPAIQHIFSVCSLTEKSSSA